MVFKAVRVWEAQVNEANDESTTHVQDKQVFVGGVIGEEYFERMGLFVVNGSFHGNTSQKIIRYYTLESPAWQWTAWQSF